MGVYLGDVPVGPIMRLFKEEQEKTVVPQEEDVVVLPDSGKVINKITVKRIPEEYTIPRGEIDILENGLYNVKDYETANVMTEAREDLDTELAEQDSLLSELESLVDNFSDKKDLDKEYNLGYAKQMDIVREIGGGNPLVERDYTESEMQKLEATLVSLTQGE